MFDINIFKACYENKKLSFYIEDEDSPTPVVTALGEEATAKFIDDFIAGRIPNEKYDGAVNLDFYGSHSYVTIDDGPYYGTCYLPHEDSVAFREYLTSL